MAAASEYKMAAVIGDSNEAQKAARLEEAESQAVCETQTQIDKLRQIKGEYEELKGTLKKLPEEMTHDIMVPISKKAFMPGKLVHTNEILVLLGDNWFVETSATRATEIASRRMKRLDDMISTFEDQKKLFEDRKSFTSDVSAALHPEGEEQEIREEYVAEDFARALEAKQQRPKAVSHKQRAELMKRAKNAMDRCEGDMRSEGSASDGPIIDWDERIRREELNQELTTTVEEVEEEEEDYDEDENITDDDDGDGDDEDDDEDVPIVPFGNLGKQRPLPTQTADLSPPNLKNLSTTDDEQFDTPPSCGRKSLTWAENVEDNDAEKCDAFGSRLKAIFNSYKDDEIVVSDENDDELETTSDTHSSLPTRDSKTRLFVKNIPSEQSAPTDSDDSPPGSPRPLNGALPTVTTSVSPDKLITPPQSAPSTPSAPKSILKSALKKPKRASFVPPVQRNGDFSDDDDQITSKPAKKPEVAAVEDEIKERQVTSTSEDQTAVQQPLKKVSKFKQQRQCRS